jgi:23S rRNA (uracil1939-C5)-methyltransferase
MADKVERLVCIESSSSACEDFGINLDEYENVELYLAPVKETLKVIEIKPDLVVADPPRSGLGKDVINALHRLGFLRLVYVSCNVGTLARDARYLRELGYKLVEVSPFDLFPQTYHIETVSTWVKQN